MFQFILFLYSFNFAFFTSTNSLFIKGIAALVTPTKGRVPVRSPNWGMSIFMNIFIIFCGNSCQTTVRFQFLWHYFQIRNGKLFGSKSLNLILNFNIMRINNLFEFVRNLKMFLSSIFADEILHLLSFKQFLFFSKLLMKNFNLRRHCYMINFNSCSWSL